MEPSELLCSRTNRTDPLASTGLEEPAAHSGAPLRPWRRGDTRTPPAPPSNLCLRRPKNCPSPPCKTGTNLPSAVSVQYSFSPNAILFIIMHSRPQVDTIHLKKGLKIMIMIITRNNYNHHPDHMRRGWELCNLQSEWETGFALLCLSRRFCRGELTNRLPSLLSSSS